MFDHSAPLASTTWTTAATSRSSAGGPRPPEREAWAHSSWRSSSCPGPRRLSCESDGAKAATGSSFFRTRLPLDPLEETDAAFKRVKRQSAINKVVFPITQLPIIGPDPRQRVGKRPPSCAPKIGINRADRLIAHWDSMPRLRRQLDDHHLQSIAEEVKKAKRCGTRNPRLHADVTASSVGPKSDCCCQHGRVPQPDIASILGTSHLRALHPWDGGGCADTGAPSIKCACCGKAEHSTKARRLRFIEPGGFGGDRV